MLKRFPVILAGTAMALSACTQTPNVPSSAPQSNSAYQIQQADQGDNEGVDDASLDALIRELDAESDEPMATQSAVPMQSTVPMQTQGLDGFRTQQYGGGGGQYGGGQYGGGQYGGYGGFGYNVFSRCQRIYRRCLNRAFTYGGYGGYTTYQLCRRVRNRCVSAQWWR